MDADSVDDASKTNGANLQDCSEKTDFYLSRRMAVDEVRDSAERLKADFLEQMGVKLSAVINDMVHTMQKVDTVDRYKNIASPNGVSSTTFRSLSSPSTEDLPSLRRKDVTTTAHSSRRQRDLRSGKLPDKIFVSRPSPLTELLQVTHFKTIHHIFVSTLILIMLHNIILDLVERNTLDLGLVRLMWAFGQPLQTLQILLGLEFCGLVVVYPAFQFWFRTRHRIKSEWAWLIDYSGAFTFLLFITGMIYVPAAIMWNNPLPPASGATVTMEQCRLLMKIYAFVRSNVPRVLSEGSAGCKLRFSEKTRRSSHGSGSSGSSSSGGSHGNFHAETTMTVVNRKQKTDEDEEEERNTLKVSSSSKSSRSTVLSGKAKTNNRNNQATKETLDQGNGNNGTWMAESTETATTSGDFTSCGTSAAELRRRSRRQNNDKESFDCDQGRGDDDDDENDEDGEHSPVGTTGTTKPLKLTSLSSEVVEGAGNCDNNKGTCGTCPSYSKYLYFYVAPTLIYKDNYPRTSFVRWDYVAWNFAQVFGCIVYANFILSRYAAFYFENFGLPEHPMTVLQFCNAVFSMMIPGILGLVLGFYLLLHSWHNAFAEMLCFGDRLFYKDWWNCSSFHSYYKTWNILVHDWLYTYIFKDAWEVGLARYHKAIPTILVFVISSLFHEYVLSFTFNFFFPVLLTLFGGFGMALTFLRYSDSSVGNIFMWSGLIMGSGILASTYTMEFYARINCPVQQEDDMADFFTPRFWTCNALVWK